MLVALVYATMDVLLGFILVDYDRRWTISQQFSDAVIQCADLSINPLLLRLPQSFPLILSKISPS